MSDTSSSSGDQDSIPIGTLVTITGLQSEEGKRLNGARGMILSCPSPSVNGGVPRYPVYAYALLDGEVVPRPMRKKSIKGKNLRSRDKKCDDLDFKNAAADEARRALSKTPREIADRGKALFWVQIYHDYWPDDVEMSLNYASLLRIECKQPKEAWKILRKTLPSVPLTFPMIDELRYDACLTCCRADGNIEEALAWALRIDTSSPEKKQLSIEALQLLATHCRGGAVDVDAGDGHKLDVHRRAARAMLERDPHAPDALRQAAAAECLLGDNREGVRLYRRALDTGRLSVEDKKTLRNDLALAQMQCPGGPMERYRAIGMTEDNGKWICIDKRATGTYDMEVGMRQPGSCEQTVGITPTTPDGTSVCLFNIPDPDDAEAYGNADIPPI